MLDKKQGLHQQANSKEILEAMEARDNFNQKSDADKTYLQAACAAVYYAVFFYLAAYIDTTKRDFKFWLNLHNIVWPVKDNLLRERAGQEKFLQKYIALENQFEVSFLRILLNQEDNCPEDEDPIKLASLLLLMEAFLFAGSRCGDGKADTYFAKALKQLREKINKLHLNPDKEDKDCAMRLCAEFYKELDL